ncbi:hypothetical protein BDW62DRAFT_202629 [Aspergillus aurantiobrunneus]
MYSEIIEFSADDRYRLYDSLTRQDIALPSDPEATLRKVSFIHTSDSAVILSDQAYHFIPLASQEFFAARYFVRYWLKEERLPCIQLPPLLKDNDGDVREKAALVLSQQPFLPLPITDAVFPLLKQGRNACELVYEIAEDVSGFGEIPKSLLLYLQHDEWFVRFAAGFVLAQQPSLPLVFLQAPVASVARP